MLSILLLVSSMGSGNLTLPKVLDSLMVLQRAPKSAQVWGWGSPSAQVSVSLDGKKVSTATVDGDGKWKTFLPPQPASINHTLTFESTDGGAKTLLGVAFGTCKKKLSLCTLVFQECV